MVNLYCSFESISPYVRFADVVRYSPFEETTTRVAYDSRLFLVKSGSAEVFIKGQSFPLRSGDALIILSGTPYRFIIKDTAFSFFVANFDFFTSQEDENNPTPLPLPMCDIGNFDKNKRTEFLDIKNGFLENGFFIEKNAFYIQCYFEAMVKEYKRMELLFGLQLSSLLKLCLNEIYRRSTYNQKTSRLSGHEDILAYISEHFHQDLTNHLIAKQFHYHPNYISQLVKEQTGLSLRKYLLRLRMLKAADLLLSCNFSVNEISAQCGFNSPSYFTQYFKKFFGCTPKAFRGEK